MEVTKDFILEEIRQISGIDADLLFDKGILTLDHARKWIVKQKYFALAKSGRTYTDIKLELSVDFGLSVSTIEKLIYRK